MAHKKLRRRQVALIVETSLGSGRDILRGIAKYAREHGTWSIYHEQRSLEEAVPKWIARWQGDGIIARVQNRVISEAVLSTGLPAVDVLGLVQDTGLPLVHVDDAAIAHLAAEHLLERGFHHFGFCAISGAPWSDARQRVFAQIIEGRGHTCSVCRLPPDTRHQSNWDSQQNKLTKWVRSLPRPVGVMVCNDPRGQLVIEACRRAGLAVPEEVAVVGVDNDEPICEICNPPLSSVVPDHRRVGYEAAALLDRLMDGDAADGSPIYIPPIGLVTRMSSDVLAVDDPGVAEALRYIREYARDGINVDDVVRNVPLSRSTLQRRFQAVLGRTVNDEILRVRLRCARELLEETNLPIEQVADKSGFTHRQYLGEVFKKQYGETPAAYRNKQQGTM